jgi:hypothetical protein
MINHMIIRISACLQVRRTAVASCQARGVAFVGVLYNTVQIHAGVAMFEDHLGTLPKMRVARVADPIDLP